MTWSNHDSGGTTLAATGSIVHLALWSPLVNRTRCGVEFAVGARRTEADVDCMACVALTDTYEVPLQSNGPGTNHFDERVWFKQVFGPPYGHVTDCCHADNPCPYHAR